MLLQSTVALTVSRNYSKVAYLKWLKFRVVHLLFLRFFFFVQPSAIMHKVTPSKQPLTVRKFFKDGSFATFHTTIPT